ncbi:hypothetical protein So717_01380 [Roseobacter cerasinus]|uniref:DUF2147 domain-containing protein n=1 Tax=Roseobacter cerasinus TaxID=2602289 RepID=A0A640VNF0_9RHOB|nr:DUF2147 domain-containing protein [Roseobacter cerasinus]GFE48385.1 hypothetical protein So717_01380 [Roseobacter cerasinus]
MIKHITTALTFVLACGVAQADPIEGLWQTEPDEGAYALVRMAPCGANYCGTIDQTFNADGAYPSKNIGKTLVIDMAAEGEGKYRGKVWRPSNDKIYLGKIALNGDSMRLSGCVAGGLICSKQTWQRVR